MGIKDVLNELIEAYPKIKRATWLFGGRAFAEFEVQDLGVGIYSTSLKKVILPPGQNWNFQYDKPMGYITFNSKAGHKTQVVTVNGQLLGFDKLR